jgi:hypothetical protein
MGRKLIVLLSLFTLLYVGLSGCNSTTATKETIPIGPKYTADQVIAVAQAQYPLCYKSFGVINENNSQTQTLINVKYIGEYIWEVNIKCPDYLYSLIRKGSGINSLTLYFYETDGSLRDTYYP